MVSLLNGQVKRRPRFIVKQVQVNFAWDDIAKNLNGLGSFVHIRQDMEHRFTVIVNCIKISTLFMHLGEKLQVAYLGYRV